MLSIKIDNISIDAPEGTTVLQAALDNGIFIPHYCWHPILSVSGNCRMCLVEIEGRPKLEVSRNLPVADGMVIKTDTPAVQAARKDVLEFLLINHPLDCPICDQAGECLLQDYHFKYSRVGTRFKEEKAHKPKAVDVGKHVKLDNERCILCSRCVRFCAEVVKDSELCIAQRGDRSFITTAPGKKLDNPYSLNTVDMCPVGALTSKDFRFQKRVWFLKSSPSICPHCSNGCPIWIDHDCGVMYRWRPREAGDRRQEAGQKYISPNQIAGTTFLCDEGRLTYKEWQKETRLCEPLIASENGFRKASVDEALKAIKEAFAKYKNVIGLISAQCSCEEVDAFVKRFDNVYTTKRRPNNPSEDNIIRKRDKNPNSEYLRSLGIKDIPVDITGDVLFITDTLSDDDVMKVVNFKWKMIVQLTHDKSLIVPGASVILPLATFAETNGTFVNHAGVSQVFSKAFDAPCDAKSVSECMEMLK